MITIVARIIIGGLMSLGQERTSRLFVTVSVIHFVSMVMNLKTWMYVLYNNEDDIKSRYTELYYTAMLYVAAICAEQF
jgi:hypothetical protein